jgi:hypothetical protein
MVSVKDTLGQVIPSTFLEVEGKLNTLEVGD